MDTRLKNTRSITWGISSLLAVIAATVTSFSIAGLSILYDIRYMEYWKADSNLVEEGDGWWEIMDIEEMDPVISRCWMILVVALLAALLFILISFVVTGKKDGEGIIRLNWFDRIFTDVQILALFGLGVLIVMIGILEVDIIARTDWFESNVLGILSKEQADIYEEWNRFYNSGFEPYWLEIFFTIAADFVMISAFLLLSQSVIKKLKTGSFWKNTIIGRLVSYVYGAAKASEGVFWKLMVICVLGALISASWLGLIPIFILIFIFVPKWAKKYTAVKTGVAQIKAGNLSYKIPVESDGELDRLAMGINEISEAMNIAVQNELKNQRMKTDLISNVSHDLRTPLTSMISYVDLLKTEGLDSENASDYLEIIDRKTRRLKKLTDDLFEAAKASSGNISVDLAKIEMSSIVNQAIGEMEGRLAANDLEVIYTNKADTIFVMADGQLLWRVIENLLTNVSKYALPGSRVYMDIREDAEMIYLDVKNMSKDQLNISADELMERFKRGDESRNTEGSGLGLSIAKDLTALMNGEFSIVIDGDLFKATVALRKAL